MKRWFTLLAVLLVALSVVIGWANHLDNPLLNDVRADLVVVEKSKRELTVYSQGKPLKTYKVALGREPVGPKRREGDKKTPEGRSRSITEKPTAATSALCIFHIQVKPTLK
jgi:murein L,D-transpeptidase YafK